MIPATAHISKSKTEAPRCLPAATTGLSERPTNEEIDQFALRIANIVAKSGAFDAFCDRIDSLLAKADAARR
jgi:hypothetical protein